MFGMCYYDKLKIFILFIKYTCKMWYNFRICMAYELDTIINTNIDDIYIYIYMYIII